MGSALLNTVDELELAASAEELAPALRTAGEADVRLERAAKASGTSDALRAQVAERLAAHRSRRGGAAQAQAATEAVRPAAAGRSAQIAAAVAERYARTPSYREALAAEAARSIEQARAAAEVAAQNAQAIAAAQQRLLAAYDEHARREAAQPGDSLAAARQDARLDGFAERGADAVPGQELWPDLHAPATRAETARAAKTARRAGVRTAAANAALESRATAASNAAAGLTVRLYEQDAARGGVLRAQARGVPEYGGLREERGYGDVRGHREDRRGYGEDRSDAEAMALDEEIAFRQAPVFEEPVGPPMALPANLIEFPRQLVAARKARPRYAEGPLRDEMEAAPGDGQLRIFEVDPAQISTSPAEVEMQAAQWTSLWLDSPVLAERAADAKSEAGERLAEPPERAAPALEPASLARRCAAGAINSAILVCGLLMFAAVIMAVASHGVAGDAAGATALAQAGLQVRTIAIIGAVSGAFLLLAYHGLFFWFSSATPGMRCVRIALCTFEDENPTRKGVRRRMAATMLSSCSLGMGYAWAALDEERLTWHDRMSGMYLRRY
jgi:hypothetical protein